MVIVIVMVIVMVNVIDFRGPAARCAKLCTKLGMRAVQEMG
jgi:hypothetical protein